MTKEATTYIWSPLGEYRVTVNMGMQQLAGIIDLLRGHVTWDSEASWHQFLAKSLEENIEWHEQGSGPALPTGSEGRES